MLDRDPEMLGDRLGRRDRPPISEHRLLHPGQIDGVVDVAHEIDVARRDGEGVMMGRGGGRVGHERNLH